MSRRSILKDNSIHSPRVENMVPSSTALLTNETLNAAFGWKSGIKFAFAWLNSAGVGGMISASRNAFRARANSAGVATRQVWRSSNAAFGRATALTVAAKAKKENSIVNAVCGSVADERCKRKDQQHQLYTSPVMPNAKIWHLHGICNCQRRLAWLEPSRPRPTHTFLYNELTFVVSEVCRPRSRRKEGTDLR